MAIGLDGALGLTSHQIGVAQAAVESGPLGLQRNQIGVDGDGLLIQLGTEIGIAQQKTSGNGLGIKAQILMVDFYGIGVLCFCVVEVGQAQQGIPVIGTLLNHGAVFPHGVGDHALLLIGVAHPEALLSVPCHIHSTSAQVGQH